MIVLDLPEPVAGTVETMAARAGMTASSWLADQIVHAFGTGRVVTDPNQPHRRTHRGRRSRAAIARAAARKAATIETPTNE